MKRKEISRFFSQWLFLNLNKTLKNCQFWFFSSHGNIYLVLYVLSRAQISRYNSERQISFPSFFEKFDHSFLSGEVVTRHLCRQTEQAGILSSFFSFPNVLWACISSICIALQYTYIMGGVHQFQSVFWDICLEYLAIFGMGLGATFRSHAHDCCWAQ